MDQFYGQMKLNHEKFCVNNTGMNNNGNMRTDKEMDEAVTEITEV